MLPQKATCLRERNFLVCAEILGLDKTEIKPYKLSMNRTRAFFRRIALFLSLAAAGFAYYLINAPSGISQPDSKTQDISYGDPSHIHFFKYQAYLIQIGLEGETAKTWGKLKTEEKTQKVQEGEEFLKAKLAEILNKAKLEPDDSAFLKAVWGDEMTAAAKKLSLARANGDATQIDRVRQVVAEVSKTIQDINLSELFDGAATDAQDYLKAEPPPDFLESLKSPDIREVLSSQENFAKFLKSKKIADEILSGLLAMHSLLDKAQGDKKTEISHLLPTLVKFLNDGKDIVFKKAEETGGIASAEIGDYDRPKRINLSQTAQKMDPLIIGSCLAHELQHVYDNYAGRSYTLDSELRGARVDVLYQKILKETAPEKYAQLANSNDDDARTTFVYDEELSKALDQGLESFVQFVAFNRQYSKWDEGVFMGRVPLREALDSNFGIQRQLAAMKFFQEQSKTWVKELEERQETVRNRLSAKPSRELDRELERVTKDLLRQKSLYADYSKAASLLEIRIRRMQSEVQWLDSKAEKTGQSTPHYDLHLAVDENYITP